MTAQVTWSINDMTRNTADGGVTTVYWSCTATDDVEGCSAVEAGKLRLDPDPSSPDYIPYADLTENDVLDWVYNSLIEGDETADEAKARIEADRNAKVQKQIDAAATTESGVPWNNPVAEAA